MSLLRSFAPWIAFLVLTSAFGWRVGLAAGLLAEAAVIATSRPPRFTWMESAMLAFFVVMAVVAFARPDSGLENSVSVLSTAWLGAVALVSLLVGKPFTLDFSRNGVPPEVAASPVFLRTNQIITGVWTAYFGVTAILGAIAVASNGHHADRVLQIILLVATIKFTIEYPKNVRARMHSVAAQS